jgi:hypothetical protein
MAIVQQSCVRGKESRRHLDRRRCPKYTNESRLLRAFASSLVESFNSISSFVSDAVSRWKMERHCEAIQPCDGVKRIRNLLCTAFHIPGLQGAPASSQVAPIHPLSGKGVGLLAGEEVCIIL